MDKATTKPVSGKHAPKPAETATATAAATPAAAQTVADSGNSAVEQAIAEGDAAQQRVDTAAERKLEAAEQQTQSAADEGRLPETSAITNPAPATEMDGASGAFVEDEIKAAIPVDHPAIDNSPRAGTSAIQNGGDFNDPLHRDPVDPSFAGQGLDLSVYGKVPAADDKK